MTDVEFIDLFAPPGCMKIDIGKLHIRWLDPWQALQSGVHELGHAAVCLLLTGRPVVVSDWMMLWLDSARLKLTDDTRYISAHPIWKRRLVSLAGPGADLCAAFGFLQLALACAAWIPIYIGVAVIMCWYVISGVTNLIPSGQNDGSRFLWPYRRQSRLLDAWVEANGTTGCSHLNTTADDRQEMMRRELAGLWIEG